MMDSQSTQMGRGKSSRRNKSTASVGSKKIRTQSTNSAKFQLNVDGFHAFVNAVSKLGGHGNEFTWHDLRKVYHKETQRQLTAEELNAIFSAKNLTKREIFELPRVKRFMTSMDGSMMCRFRLIAEPENHTMDDDDDELPPLMTTSLESDSVTQSTSPDSSDRISPVNEQLIAITTDCDSKAAGPTSDLSKSETSPSQSLVQQSSMTDDEGWASGRDTRSDNSSPVNVDLGKDEIDGGLKTDLEDEVFESEQRIAAGSDCIDGSIVTDMMIVEKALSEDVLEKKESSQAVPIVVTESLSAAFEAVIQSVANANTVLSHTQNETVNAKVHASPRKVLTKPVPAARTTVTSDELSAGPPIKQLIEKFDTGVNFADYKHAADDATSPKSKGSHKNVELSATKKEEHEKAECTNVIFRTTSTHSNIMAQGKEQLAQFVAEQEAKQKDRTSVTANTTTEETETAFCAKEQSSMSSLDRQYFDSRTKKNEDLFAELGVQDADGFQLQSGGSNSNESGPPSSEVITVIEAKDVEKLRKRADSAESDADVPYSLCSEDEAEPMTMIEKSMKGSQSAEQLSPAKEEQKAKTVVVNVELDAKANKKNKKIVSPLVKERLAALHAELAKKQVPIAKSDSVEEKEPVSVLRRREELPHVVLEARPSPQAVGPSDTIRRRQVRFMRGCCVVQ